MGSVSTPEPTPPASLLREEPCTTIDELILRRAATHAHQALISYPSHETQDFVDYTGADLERITRRGAAHLASTLHQIIPGGFKVEPSDENPQLTKPVVALVGISSLEYYFTFLSLQRLGITTLFISPRLADPGYIHLLTKTGCRIAIASGPSLDTLDRLRNERSGSALGGALALVPMLDAAFITKSLTTCSTTSEQHPPALTETQRRLGAAPARPGFIIHSGGTTGLPKPVPLDAAAWLQQAGDIVRRIPRLDTLSTLPLFHSFGLATLLRGLVGGTRLSLLDAARPVTAAVVGGALDATASRALVTVPYTLKFLVEAEGGAERLGQLAQVINAGSAIPDDLGDRLVAAGASIFHLYGQTESGALMEPPPGDRRLWSWVTPLPHAAPYLRFEREGDESQNLYHLVVLPGLRQKVLSDRPDGSYGTKDLFQRHPQMPNLWKFVARKDDIIVMLNGEKADPIPVEEAVTGNPNVRAAVAFGAGRDALGLLVIRSSTAPPLSRDEFVATLLSDLELGNSRVPAYARISSEMIVVKDADTPFPATDKATIIRAAFLKTFEADIDEAYAARQKLTTAHDDEGPLSYGQILERVSKAVEDELRAKRGRDKDGRNDVEIPIASLACVDFFDIGLDSLQASNIRSRLLREINLHGRPLATNVVFDHPNVELLSKYILKVHLDQVEEAHGADLEKGARSMVAKYSEFGLIQRGSLPTTPGKEYVLLTGATGQIGAHILATLLKQDTVQRVFCLVRASDEEAAHSRIVLALKDARLLEDLCAPQLKRVVACPGDLSAEDGRFGLSDSLYEAICTSVTAIVHNAWAVNFNLGLLSFESQSIRPTHHLARLAMSSRLRQTPTLTFVSSIATVLRAPLDDKGKVLERRYGWDAVGAGLGYGQSKWVAEEVLAAAAAARSGGLEVRIARLGQVVGDTRHGRWKAAEAYPTVVRSALTVGALPLVEPASTGEVHDAHYWLPVDRAASAIVEIALHRSGEGHGPRLPRDDAVPSLSVLNVTNPKPMRWNSEFLPMARDALERYGVSFETVPQREWLRRLEQSDPDVSKNPPRKLLQFFKGRYGTVEEPGEPALDMANANEICPSLPKGDSAGLSKELLGKFVEYWMEECWQNKFEPSSR